MNEPISWDPSLIKKFSSSNHFKLLNQLRNEVKMYPLNNRKRSSTIQINDTSLNNKNISNSLQAQNSPLSNNINPNNELNSNKSNVSFNNSKNFSIYKKSENNNNNIIINKETFKTDNSKSNDEVSTPSFKEGLNQIDMN